MINVICYRGKLINHDELCVSYSLNQEIEDVELIERLYFKYGEQFVNLIEGNYAIVISDEEKYLLVRDRVGFKSLYYIYQNGVVLYGLNLREIVERLKKEPTINCNAVYHYLSFWALPEDMTWFENIYKVEPGTYIVIQNGKISKTKYYSFGKFINNSIADNKDDVEKRINELLRASIRKKQKKYTIALSGGIDSCLLAALSSHLDMCFDTISVYINDNRDNEEIRRIESISKYINPNFMDYRSCVISMEHVNEVVHWITRNTYEPMQLLDMMLILTLLYNGDNEFIFGEGADELGGYSEYIKANDINKLLNTRLQKVHNERFYKNFYLCNKHVLGLTEWQKKRIWKKRIESSSYDYLYTIANEIKDEVKDSYIRKLQNIDFSFRLPEYLLKRTDTISQLTGTQIDFPFLSRELIEYCVQIDKEIMMDRSAVKKIFRSILNTYIESNQWEKNKIGMGDELSKYMEDIVLRNYKNDIEINSNHPLYEFLNRDELEKLMINNKYIVWSIYSLGVWLEEIS